MTTIPPISNEEKQEPVFQITVPASIIAFFFSLIFLVGTWDFFFLFQLGLPQPLHTLVLFVVSFLQNFSLVKKTCLNKMITYFFIIKKDCTYSPIKTNKMKVFPWKNKTMNGLRARYEVGHFSSFFPFF